MPQLERLAIVISASVAEDGEGLVTLQWMSPAGAHQLVLSIPMAERTALSLSRAVGACILAGGQTKGSVEEGI